VSGRPLAPAAGLPGIPVGTLVRDEATGRTGVLMDACPYPVRPGWPGSPRVLHAFLRPPGGGTEWTTRPDMLSIVTTGR
jgi:hypothetical protein